MSVLYLCEKPSQAADLAKVLGDPRRRESHFETARGLVTYAIGHLLELDEPGNHDPRMKGAWRLESLPFEPLAFRYVPKQSTRGQLSAIGKLLKSATTVVIATDAGREGEMIGREILDHRGFQEARSSDCEHSVS